MNFFTRFLIKRGVIHIDDLLLRKWAKRKKVSSLIYALKFAHYTNRAYAARLLGQFQSNHEAIEALNEALDDSMNFVSQEAIKSLEQMTIPAEIRLNVQTKKQYWENVQPEITKMKKKIKGNMAGFHDNGSSIPDPSGFVDRDSNNLFGSST